MPVTFHIFKDRGLVYVKYEGFARVEETMCAFGEYAQHPDCRPGQKQLVDLSGVEGFERNYAELMKLQARKADVFNDGAAQTLIVYYAPNPEVYEMALLVERSWEPFPAVVSLVQQNEADALALLGQPESSFAELLESAS